MALKFVTSKSGEAHIKSADWKSLNRGLAGTGKYILSDTPNNTANDFVVSVEQGQITIPPRSFVWSGAHIRNTTSATFSYVPPTVTSTINVWFHYTKDADSGIETLDFLTTIDSQPSPILDEVEDSTLEAYTLLFSFSHNVATTTADNVEIHFTPIKSLDEMGIDLDVEVNERKINDEDHEQRISAAETTIEGLKAKTEVLADGLNSRGNAEIEVNTQDDVNDFRFFIILRRIDTTSDKTESIVIPAIKGTYYMPQTITESVAVTSATKTTILNPSIVIREPFASARSKFVFSYIANLNASDDNYNKLTTIKTIIGVK